MIDLTDKVAAYANALDSDIDAERFEQVRNRALWRGTERGMNMEWQPIETAPLNVTLLLYGAKRLEMCVGMNHSRYGWVTDTTSEWVRMYPPTSIYPPTHWMPLPPPPQIGRLLPLPWSAFKSSSDWA